MAAVELLVTLRDLPDGGDANLWADKVCIHLMDLHGAKAEAIEVVVADHTADMACEDPAEHALIHEGTL